jgi:hypothetical protein
MNLLRRPASYIAYPLLLACAVTLATYRLPDGYGAGLALLCGSAVGMLLIDRWLVLPLPPTAWLLKRSYAGSREAFVALAFALVIVVFCVLDLAFFPIPLFEKPSGYAVMENGREHIRHISDMCWVLPPIGLLCTRKPWLRRLLVTVGLVFPILVIDRNRIFDALFALAMLMLMRREQGRALPWHGIVLVGLIGGTLFGVLGMLRSGSLASVALPVDELFRNAPGGVQWLLIYASAGPYNFASILAKGYHNSDFLLHQLVPGTGSIATLGTDIPLDASNINVGSEFFPFLMAWGPVGAVAAIFMLHAMMAWSTRRLRRGMRLFPLLIFLRMTYVCVMAPFAPQAFTWTNAGFVVLCLAMQLGASWLPNRRAAALAAPPLRPASESREC